MRSSSNRRFSWTPGSRSSDAAPGVEYGSVATSPEAVAVAVVSPQPLSTSADGGAESNPPDGGVADWLRRRLAPSAAPLPPQLGSQSQSPAAVAEGGWFANLTLGACAFGGGIACAAASVVSLLSDALPLVLERPACAVIEVI